jgi:signal transduction histidine kinase
VLQTASASERATESDDPARGTGRLESLAAIGSWLTAVGFLAVSAAYMIPVRDADIDGLGSLRPGDVADLGLNLTVATFGALIVLRGRDARYGWLMLTIGAVNSFSEAAAEFALYGWYVDEARDSILVEATIWLQDAVALGVLAAIVLLLPSLFPDGRAIGRWRRPVRVTSALWLIWWICFAFGDRPAENMFYDLPEAPDNPVGLLPSAIFYPMQVSWVLLMLASVVIAIGSVRTRWRRSIGDERQQLKWVLFALAVAGAVMLASVIEAFVAEAVGLEEEWITSTGIPLAWVGVMIALGLGVLRYRLYDVDLVINRTVVYAVMSLVVIAVYALVVTGIAALLPDVTDTGASLVAAAVVALAFAPVRSEVQDRVDRLMFGRRSDPIGVIAEVGTTLASSDAPDAALRAIADTVVAALKLPGAAIVVGPNGDAPTVTSGTLARSTKTVPLRYQGETVGRLIVARRSPSEALAATDRQLLHNVAHYAAGVAHTVELNRALQRSRERLVVAREEERRRLRRDLHDGLGPSLASQTFRLDAALAQLEREPAAAAEHLRALKSQNRELVADIRRLVYELRPPALDELGLAGAVATYANQYADTDDITVTTHTTPDPLGDLPAAVEVAGYRIVTEAITNAVRHADGSRCDVAISRSDGALTITVDDDGNGPPATVTPGVGLTSMRERAAELGGTLTVGAGQMGGMHVAAILPTRADGVAPNGATAAVTAEAVGDG